MKLFIHIGTPKTGTTTIQTFLEGNRDALAARGVILPRTLGRQNHRDLTAYSLNDEIVDNLRRAKRLTKPERLLAYRTRVEQTFGAERDTWPDDATVVLTSEQLIRLHRPGELERLRRLLGPLCDGAVRIIVYLRRQDEYFASEYSQLIKGGNTLAFTADNPIKRSTYDYSRLVGGWAAAFGAPNVIVRPFEREEFLHGRLVDDFMALIGITDLSGLAPPVDRNSSLDAHTLEFLRMVNPLLPRWLPEGGSNPERARFIAELESVSDGPKIRLSPEDAERFLARFAQSNEAVARKFLRREDGVLFRASPQEVETMAPSLSLEQAVATALQLWRTASQAAITTEEEDHAE